MLGFIGEYALSADTKGRILIPSGFRKQLPLGQGDKFVINRGFESCLTLYTMDRWEKITSDLDKLNYANPKAREYKRLFLNGATLVEPDNMGRVLLPKMLLSHAGITKDLIFSAQSDKVELWDAATYQSYLKEHLDNFTKLAEEVAGGDFINPLDLA